MIDGETLATFLDIAPSTIRMWATRGKITKHGTDWRRRTLYDADEVLRHFRGLAKRPDLV